MLADRLMNDMHPLVWPGVAMHSRCSFPKLILSPEPARRSLEQYVSTPLGVRYQLTVLDVNVSIGLAVLADDALYGLVHELDPSRACHMVCMNMGVNLNRSARHQKS